MLKGGVSRANAELLVAALSPSPQPSPSRERGFAGCCWIRVGGPAAFHPLPCPLPRGRGGLLAAAGFAGGAAAFHPLPCPLPRGRGGLLAAAGFAGALQLFILSPALSLEGEGVCWLLLESQGRCSFSPSPLPSPSRERGFAGCCWIRGGRCSISPSPLPSPWRERGFAGCCWHRPSGGAS